MKIQEKLSQVVLWGVGTTTLVVTPFMSFDPMTVPRFSVLLTFGIVGFFLIIQLKTELFSSSYRKVLVAAIAFISWATISTFVSGINLVEGFFGINGRQTGLLTYFGFTSLMICSVLSSNRILIEKISFLFLITGSVSGIYGVIQSVGGDPFDWVNPYSPVFGFFGNPNFQSSFMGITGVVAAAASLDKTLRIKHKIILGFFLVLAFYNIYETKSQQGYLVFLIGILVVFFLYLRTNRHLEKFSAPFAIISMLIFLALILDILQKSPWKTLLYKDSVSLRGDYWRAGLKMSLDHPIFGVGLDGYRDHFRQSRDQVAAARENSGAVADSAHNVFLDISSGGGLPLLLVYVFFIGLTFLSAVRLIRRSTVFDAYLTSLLAAWIAYVAQSLISISQLGLAVWGWVLMGTIIGYEISSREKLKDKHINSQFSGAFTLLGLILSLAIALPPYVTDAKFRSNLKSGEVLKIETSSRQWPQNVNRLTYIAQLFREANINDRSLLIARAAVEFNPMYYEAWQELSAQPNASEFERDLALKTMKKLDPFNPNLK